ncbi:MAG: hypothetical protein HY247_05820 [archaeon]|nr:MAG: hypothetical protein HY247_05820 [archaeon]
MTDQDLQGIWFERLCQRTGVPFWVGVLLYGVLPVTLLLPASYFAAGLWGGFVSGGGLGLVPLLVVVTIYTLYASRFVRRRLEGVASYANTLIPAGQGMELRELYGIRGIAVTYVALVTIVQYFYLEYEIPGSYSLLQGMMISAAFFYWNVFIITFIFAFAYSLYKIYQAGKLPLVLRPFTEDRTLGLRPFGRLSLQLTALYILMVAIIIVPQTGLGYPAVPLVAFGAILMLGGIVLFMVPLLSLHGRLVEAKRMENGRLAPQYTELVHQLNQDGVKNSDVRLFHQLMGIDKVQRDIQQIHTWPFDVGIITRLAAIVFSVVAILLANYLRLILKF